MDFFNRFLGRNSPGATARPGWPPAPQAQYPAAWSAPKVKPSISPTAGLRGAGRLLGPVSIGLDLYATGRQVFNPQDNIITRLGALGNSIENVIGSGGGVPKASKPLQKRPDGYSSYGTYTVGGIEYDINSGRPTYMPPGSVYPSSSVAPLSPAAERDYRSQKSAVAQQVAQDPALSKYDRDRAAAIASGDQAKMDAVRDQGMAIWAAKYGGPDGLASKVKPGQSGYETIQGVLAGNAARSGQGFSLAEQLVPTPQGFPTQVPSLSTGTGYATGFGLGTQLTPGIQTPPPYSTIRPTSELSGLGATPLGTAPASSFGQPNVMDPEQFQKLLKMVQK